MPTIRLPTTIPTSPQLKRTERNNRRRARPDAISPTTTTTTNGRGGRTSATKTKRVSSIHSSPPPICDRESSLYPHRVYASPTHDWSKSCNDLHGSFSTSTLASGLEFSPFSLSSSSGGAKPKAESIKHQQHGNVYGIFTSSRSVACLTDTYTTSKGTRPLSLSRGSRWFQSVIDVDFAIDESDDQATEIESKLYGSTGSSTARNSSIGLDLHGDKYDYICEPAVGDKKKRDKENKWFRSFWRVKEFRLGNKKSRHIMSTSTPVVPPRSALRTVPAPRAAEAGDVDTAMNTLRLGPSLAKTPSLSSGSDADIDVFDDATTHLPAGTAYRSPTTEEKERGFFGRKKVLVERDPMKVRDGREAKTSPTGVYTPPTFPGACGPRPSHFPSHVYTPQNFQLYPTPEPSAGPSRSSSSSSTATADMDLPQTPVSPTFRVFGNKAMAGLRRMSGQIAAYSPTQARDRDSYFSYSSTSSRQSSLGPLTPNSAHFPAGLGVGLTEKDGITLAAFPLPPTTTLGESRARSVSTYGVDGSPAVKRVAEAPKTKRKPVPEVAEPGSDEEGAVAHAL